MPPRTVGEIIRDLNAAEIRTGGTGLWQQIDGVQALTTVTKQTDGHVNFALGSGVLIKGFINNTTGEIKLFPAKMLGFPEQEL